MSSTSKSGKFLHFLAYLTLLTALGFSGFLNYHTYIEGETLFPDTFVVQSDSCENLKALHEAQQIEYDEAIDELDALKHQIEETVIAAEPIPVEPKPEPKPEKKASNKETLSQSHAQAVESTVSCSGMYQGSVHISKACRKKITAYVENYPDARYFEVTGVVDGLEFKLFNLLDKKPKLYSQIGIDSESVRELKKYAQQGLAKQRALEASWVIKAHTKREAKTYNAYYTIVSKDGSKGILVRAYQ